MALSIAGMAAAPAPAVVFPLSDPPQRVGPADGFALLDFDCDGRVDIAGVRDLAQPQSQAYLLRGTASGFAPPQTVNVPASGGRMGVVAADLSGDACDELVVTFDWSAQLVVLRGNRDGRLSAPAAADVYSIGVPSGYPRLTAVDAADLDGDGDMDVAAALGSDADFNRPPDASEGGAVTIFANDSSGALAPTGQRLAVNAPSDLMLVALAGDTDPDLVVAETNKPADTSLKVIAGDIGAAFGPSAQFAAGPFPFQLDRGDFDRDGRADIVVAHRSVDSATPLTDPASILPGLATAAALGGRVEVPDALGSQVAVADLDRDGHDDLYIADGRQLISNPHASDDPIFVRGLGDFMFDRGLQSRTRLEHNEHHPQVGDVNGDGRLDVITTGSDEATHHFIRHGLGPHLVPDPFGVDFGTQAVGTRTTRRSFRFTNQGPGVATGITRLRDGAAADFPLEHDSCAAATLRIGESCVVGVAFAPADSGQRLARIAMRATDSDFAFFAQLNGTGVTPAPSSPPASPATGRPTATPTSRAALLRHGLRFRQLVRRPGSMRWTLELPRRATRTATLKTVIVARAMRTVRRATTLHITLRPSRTGRRLIAARRATRVLLRSTFTDVANKRFQTVTPIRLRR